MTRNIDDTLSPAKVAHAYPELRCIFGGRSVVPDISVFRWERIPRESNGRVSNRFELHPDWVIEILSPGQSQTKINQNILHCLNHGTEMGWMIDSEASCIFVHQLNQTLQCFDEPQMVLPVPAFAGAIKITVKQLFDWLTD